MQPNPPFWFKQRQAKAEPAGADTILRLTGPNLPEAFITIGEGVDGHWRAALRSTPDGDDLDATEPEFDNPADAWDAAFELYRTRIIV
jgi:hypothetical protein